MEPALIRRFDPARDADLLRRCFVALQDHEHAFDSRMPTGESIADEYLAWMHERVAHSGGAVLVAVVDDELAGFATVLAPLPRTDPDDRVPAHALLSELSVLPGFRNRGIGHALIGAAETFARKAGVPVLRVPVMAQNTHAQRLYAGEGFDSLMVLMEKSLD